MNDQATDVFVNELWDKRRQEWADYQVGLAQGDCLKHGLVRESILDGDFMRPRQSQVKALRERVVCGAEKEYLHVGY